MCITNKIGSKITIPKNNTKILDYLFGEDQSRYIVEVEEKNIKEVNNILKDNNVYFEKIGKTQKNFLEIENEFKISLNELNQLYKFWFNNYFGD